jgi:SAM-dependent methyltransferase
MTEAGLEDLRQQLEKQQAALTALQSAGTELRQLTSVVALLNKRHCHDLPLPPEYLRLHVGAQTSAANFMAQGANSSERVLEIFGENPAGAILDWGCGSGRTLRWLLHYAAWRENYRGCDVDREAIEWLRQNGQSNLEVCTDDPPLPYADQSFDGLFAFSVLTHIHPEKHRVWYAELRRVLKPGGRAFLTTQGQHVVETLGSQLPPGTETEFSAKGFVHLKFEGHYKDAALVAESFTRRALEGLFTVEDYALTGYQNMDAFIVRRDD